MGGSELVGGNFHFTDEKTSVEKLHPLPTGRSQPGPLSHVLVLSQIHGLPHSNPCRKLKQTVPGDSREPAPMAHSGNVQNA